MINFNELKRLISYLAISLITTMLIFLMLILNFNPFISVLFGLIISLSVSFMSFIASSSTFTRILSGAEYGVLIFGSTGHLRFYTAKIQGDKFVSFINGQPVEQKFNRNLFWYVSKKINEGILKKKEQENTVIFEAPVESGNISSELFKTDYPFLVYNPSIKSFITKEWLFKKEYDSMFFNFGWELKQSIDLHNQSAGGITRKILDLIALKSRDPQTKKFLTLILGAVIIILGILLFGEPLYNFLNSFLADPTAAEKIITSNKLS